MRSNSWRAARNRSAEVRMGPHLGVQCIEDRAGTGAKCLHRGRVSASLLDPVRDDDPL